MKNINQIRENYDLLTEKEDTEARKLVSLVRAGLFDAKKLPILKRALEKDSSKMTPAERKILIELLDSLMGEVLGSQQVYSKVKQSVGHNKDRLDEAKADYLSKYDSRYESDVVEKDLPTVIILKRKAIRIFPGRQKIGLYYSQSLDRYVSIPFGPGVSNMNEETTQVDQAHSGSVKKKKKDKNLVDYDAPKKPGQASNLTKGWVKGDVSNTEYLATKAGLAVGKLFRRKKQNTSATPSTTAPVSAPQTLTKSQQAVAVDVKQRKASANKTAERSKEPGITPKQKQNRINNARRVASYALRDKRQAGIKEAFSNRLDEKRTQQIDEAGPLIPLAIGAARVASKGVSKGLQRFRVGARRSAKKIDPSGIASDNGNNPQQPKDEPYSKALEPKDFSMKVNVSAPKGRSTSGYEKRADNNQRKALEQPVSESIKLVAEGKLDSCDLNIDNNNVIINTSLAKKIDNLYESLNATNKRKMKKMLNEGKIDSFKKIVSFAVRQ